MRFIVAAGGAGTRMLPATKFVNKHLVPIGNGELMIDKPMKFLSACGAKEVSVVTGSGHATQITEYIGDGEKYGFSLVDYFVQMKPAGIADVLKRVSSRESDRGICLILGDNYFEKVQYGLMSVIGSFSEVAMCWEYDLGDPQEASRFGQVLRDDSDLPTQIIEKPSTPVHSRILTGLYCFPKDVFEKVSNLSPSARNELEITHLLDLYLKENRLVVNEVDGEWCDLGEWNEWSRFISTRT